MALMTTGLIVREHNIGEADRFITILTEHFGVIRASVRGARRVNSRSGSSTRLLSYAQLSLVKGRDKYIVESAAPQRVFFASGGSVEQLSLAQYFCELFASAAPREEEATAFLSLLLNALHLLEKGEDGDRIKATAEWRLMMLSGYMPDMARCRCGKGEAPLFFDPLVGVLTCAACRTGEAVPLTSTVYEAIRYVLTADAKKCFAFRLPSDATLQFADAAERFVTCQLSRRFQTLEFYHSIASFTV